MAVATRAFQGVWIAVPSVHVLLPTTEQELRVSHGPKRKLTLGEVLGKISILTPPIPPRDTLYFHRICGLSKEGRNPHSLPKSRNAPRGALQSIFGTANTRHAYSVFEKECFREVVVDLIHKMYPLCYSLSELPRNHPIAKELCLGIFCQHVKHDSISWAQFVEESNITHRKLYGIHNGKMLA